MQRKIPSVIAVCAIAGLAGPALADCKAELSELTGQAQMETEGKISKDGSLAPLEGGEDSSAETDMSEGAADTAQSDTGQSDTSESDGEVIKDGSTAPLETDLSGVATSGQDAAAQQDGSSDDAAENGADEMSQEAKDAIETARTALEAGDEQACMDAVKKARNS